MPDSHNPTQSILEVTMAALEDESNPNAALELEQKEPIPPYPILLPLLVQWAELPIEEQDPYFGAYLFLMERCLNYLREDLRTGEETGAQLWHFLLDVLEDSMDNNEREVLCNVAMHTLFELGLPIPEHLSEKHSLVVQQLRERMAEKPAYTQDIQNPRLAKRELLEEYAPPGAIPLDTYGLLKSELQFRVAEDVDNLLLVLLYLNSEIMLEGVLHCLLHPRALVRERLLEHLGDYPEALPPRLLNRLVMLRTWLPAEEAEQLDSIIRKQRRFDLAPAIHDDDEPLYWATVPDTNGTIAVFMSRSVGEGYEMRGALLQEHQGIGTCWQQFLADRDARDARVEELRGGLPPILPVNHRYFGEVIPHFLSLNVESGQLPDPEVLEWLESLGGNLWQPQPLDFRRWLRSHESELWLHGESASHASLAKWFEPREETLQWFESGSDTLARVEEVLRAGDASQAGKAYEYMLGPRRQEWRNRFVLMAIRARYATNLNWEPQWQHFALLAKQLDGDIPVIDLPILPKIIEKTLSNAVHAIQVRNYLEDEIGLETGEQVPSPGEGTPHW